MEPFWAFPTILGPCGVAWSESGLTAVKLGVRAVRPPNGRVPSWAKEFAKRCERHLAGKLQSFADLPLDWRDQSEFCAKIYELTRQIPAGELRTYGELAALAGRPGAARAVGQAMGRNPTPIIVPCHRVIATGGGPGGFSAPGGLSTKEKLLAIEGVALRPPLLLTEKGVVAKATAFLKASDARLRRLIERTGPFALGPDPATDLYGAFVRSIVYQQLTGKAATAILGRLATAVGKGARWRPELILEAPLAKLRGAGLSAAKAAALIDLSRFAEAGRLPDAGSLPRMTDAAIIGHLSQIRGIGPWSVEMMLMFHLQRADVFAATDYGLRKGFARVYGKRDLPHPKDLAQHAEVWRPYRTVAAWYLWRAAEEPDANKKK